MTNLEKLDFVALDITEKNYLTWVVDTKIHLEARNLGETIKEENNASSQDQAKVIIFICRHLDEGLKSEYLTVEDPLALWKALRNIYNHQKMVPRHNSSSSFKNVNHHKGKAHMNNTPRNSEGACHRCGGNGHWACTCRTPKHLMDLNQASIKEKGVETNFLDQAKPMDIPDSVCDLSEQLNTTHLDVSDFIVKRGNEVYRSD
ncbi:uncharacterized protein [Malus domestica]|uniref:uncharacterized protein n=1 Tax=Malus domestica TaxID=3750 RepID=UPI003974D357